ncbi:MAG: hypothetical protein ACKVS8_14375 [Phycisphaerales bacterium]
MARSLTHALPALAHLALLACLSGCAAEPAADKSVAQTPTSVAPPSDFALGVTVYPVQTGGSTAGLALPAYARPARYILEPGGALRVATGTGLTASTVPPITRTLAPEEAAALYTAMRDANLLVAGHGGTIGFPTAYVPPPHRSTTLISYSADGRRASLALPASDPSVRPLVEKLAALGWVGK